MSGDMCELQGSSPSSSSSPGCLRFCSLLDGQQTYSFTHRETGSGTSDRPTFRASYTNTSPTHRLNHLLTISPRLLQHP